MEQADHHARRRIGACIAAERRRAGLTPDALAERGALSAARLRAIEQGCGPSSTELFALAEALSLPPTRLLGHGPPGPGRGVEHLDDPGVTWGMDMIEQIQAAERLVARYGL